MISGIPYVMEGIKNPRKSLEKMIGIDINVYFTYDVQDEHGVALSEYQPGYDLKATGILKNILLDKIGDMIGLVLESNENEQKYYFEKHTPDRAHSRHRYEISPVNNNLEIHATIMLEMLKQHVLWDKISEDGKSGSKMFRERDVIRYVELDYDKEDDRVYFYAFALSVKKYKDIMEILQSEGRFVQEDLKHLTNQVRKPSFTMKLSGGIVRTTFDACGGSEPGSGTPVYSTRSFSVGLEDILKAIEVKCD